MSCTARIRLMSSPGDARPSYLEGLKQATIYFYGEARNDFSGDEK